MLVRMKVSGIRLFAAIALTGCLALAGTSACAQNDNDAHRAQSAPAAAPAEKPAAPAGQKEDANKLPPLPPDTHTEQSITLDGRKQNYTVTVGTLPVRDGDGKTAGELVYTAYTVAGANRPVTFALNGGPGASSVYLNFGAIGPKHVNGSATRATARRIRRR